MTLEPGEEPLPPFQFQEAPATILPLGAVGAGAAAALLHRRNAPELAKGRGVIVMGLERREKLVAVAVSHQRKLTVIGTGRGGRDKTVNISGEEQSSPTTPDTARAWDA